MTNSNQPADPSRRNLLTAGAFIGASALMLGSKEPAMAQAPELQLGEFGWGDGIRRIKEAGKIVIGMAGSMVPPQYYRDPQTNEPVGYDVEIAKMIAADLGVEPVYEEAVAAARVIGLQAGKYDIALAGTANSPMRASALAFTRGYLPYEQVVLIAKDSSLKTLEDVNKANMKVSVMLGSTAEFAAYRMFPEAEIKPLKIQEAMLEVAAGRTEACLVERYLAAPFTKNNPNTTLLGGLEHPIITAVEYGCIACRTSDMALREWLDNWVYWYDSHGVIPNLYKKIMGPTLL